MSSTFLRYELLAVEDRPVPNARTRCSADEPRRIVPIAAEEVRMMRVVKAKDNRVGALYAPCFDKDWLTKWPHVWRAPSRQNCRSELRRYRFDALVESSNAPGTFTQVYVQYMGDKSMPAEQKKHVGHVRRACKMLTEVCACCYHGCARSCVCELACTLIRKR